MFLIITNQAISTTGKSLYNGGTITRLYRNIISINKFKNMETRPIVKKEPEINAPVAKIWDALINPEIIKEYLYGTQAISEWKEGSPLLFTGT
jgi:hypothetical protein